MKYFTQRLRPEWKGEVNNEPSKTERQSHMSAKVRIENLILAGERLQQARAEAYDYPEPKEVPEDIPEDPTRVPGFDMADASQIKLEVENRLKTQKEKAEELKRLEAELAKIEADKAKKEEADKAE